MNGQVIDKNEEGEECVGTMPLDYTKIKIGEGMINNDQPKPIQSKKELEEALSKPFLRENKATPCTACYGNHPCIYCGGSGEVESE